MRVTLRIWTFFVAWFVAGAVNAAMDETDALSVSVLKTGTVNWELDTIQRHGLDRINGFRLTVRPLASAAAAKIAFESGETDAIVSDWIWVARRRAAGADHVFLPYSKAVGGLMVPRDSPVRSVADLGGRTIGIAGGPLDKSWLILQAYGLQTGFDLKAATDQVFGAPPLMFQKSLSGEIDGTINYWHFMAKLEAHGFRPLISVGEAVAALDLDPETPLLGYVLHGEFVRQRPGLVRGLAAASRAAKTILAADDAEWARLRPRMNAADDAEFERLKQGFRNGIPATSPVNEAAAARMFALMVELGGAALVGGATALPEGVFLEIGS